MALPKPSSPVVVLRALFKYQPSLQRNPMGQSVTLVCARCTMPIGMGRVLSGRPRNLWHRERRKPRQLQPVHWRHVKERVIVGSIALSRTLRCTPLLCLPHWSSGFWSATSGSAFVHVLWRQALCPISAAIKGEARFLGGAGACAISAATPPPSWPVEPARSSSLIDSWCPVRGRKDRIPPY